MENYESLADVLNDLKAKGYTQYFEMEYFTIYCGLLDIRLNPEEFTVDKTWRFEDDSTPDDSTVLYAISSKDGRVKGTLVDAYGVYAENMSFDMAMKLQNRNGL